MNLARLIAECGPDNFLAANSRTLRLGMLTRSSVLHTEAVGSFMRRADSTPVLLYKDRLLGMPLPRTEVQKALVSTKDSTLFVIFGLGTGYLPQYLRRITNAPIVVFEPSLGLLRTVLENGPLDLPDVDIVSNAHDLSIVWGRYASRRRDSVLISTPGYSAAFPDEYGALPSIVHRLVERVNISKNTYRRRAQTWVSDVLANIPLLQEGVPVLSLEGAYKGVPAFIIGAGPSLDKNVAMLEAAHKKGIIFATNSSALALAKHGVTPHLICCLESIDASPRLGTLPFINDVIRVYSLSAHPNTLRCGTGPLMPFYEALPQYVGPLESLTGRSGVAVCGSVSTAAFSIAQKLGCDPIVLVGQDLAFTDGATYAGGTGYESSRARFDTATGVVHLDWNEEIANIHGSQHGARHSSEPLLQTTAWGGDAVVSSGPSFMAINSWMESTVALNAGLDSTVRYINATEGGARVKGFEEMRLQELVDSLPDLNLTVAKLCAEALSHMQPRTAPQLQHWCQAQIADTRLVARCARRVNRLSRHALHVLHLDQPQAINRAFAALDTAEQQLRTTSAKATLVDAWCHSELDTLLGAHVTSAEPNSRNSARAALELGYQVAVAIEQAAHDLEKELQTAYLSFEEPKATTKGNSQCR
jgi:hypothetical protein